MEGAAGRYIQQSTGYKAFVPAPLPPEPPLAFDGPLQTLLSAADRDIGRLDALATPWPNPDLFVAMYVRHEAVLSSQIEGTQSTLPLSLRLLREIHAELMQGVPSARGGDKSPGEFRTSQDWIGGKGSRS